MSQRVRIVFRGEIIAGEAEAAVKQRAAQLFKASPEQIERIFSGRPVVLRKDLSAEEGARYRERLEKAGIRVYVEEMKEKNVASPSSGHASPAVPLPAISETKLSESQSQSQSVFEQSPQAAAMPSSVPAGRSVYGAKASLFLPASPDQSETPAAPQEIKLEEEKDYRTYRNESNTSPANRRSAPYRAPAAKRVETAGFLDCFGLSSSGCMNRMTYWTTHIFMGALLFFITGLLWQRMTRSMATIPPDVLSSGGIGSDAQWAAFLVGCVWIIFSIVASVQRCRDIGWSPWLLLLCLIPGVSGIFWLCLLFWPSGGYEAPRGNVKMLLVAVGVLVLSIAWAGMWGDKAKEVRTDNAARMEQAEQKEMQARKERQQWREQKEAELQREMKQKKEEQFQQLQEQLRMQK